MRRVSARSVAAATLGALLLALAGCGSKQSNEPVAEISFQGSSDAALKSRVDDMRRAAQLELDAIGGDAAGRRIKLVDGASPKSLAVISALSDTTQQGDEELLVNLRPPVRREVRARHGSRVMALDAPSIALVPAAGLALAAQTNYAASGAPGASDTRTDDPLKAGTPHGRYITAALSADGYPPAGRAFYEKFADKYGRAPDRWAIYAYEAVGLIVDAMTRAQKAGLPIEQHTVAETAMKIRNRFSPVGHYDVLPSGQTTLYVFQARGKGAPTGPASLIEALR
ncbi:MAG: ABC transporter substrate-binding protein [Solirubrobacterales bacterium]